jgi:Flp pilus assembly protein TadG
MNKQRQSRGQSLVEFALCLPVLVLIFIGVFDLGRAFNAYIIITNSAREGAFYASMHPTDTTGIRARAVAEAQASGIQISAADVQVSTTGTSGAPVTVQVGYDFHLLWSVIVAGRVIPLRSSAQMVVY